MTSIGDYAFHECSSLTNVTIPQGVTSIGECAFWKAGLTSVDIPDSVTSIGKSAFADCYSLTTAVIGDGVTSIGALAFDLCMSLTTVTIGSSVTSIEREAFDYCYALTTIRVLADPPPSWGSSNPFRMQGGQAGYAQRTVEVPSGLLSTYQGSGWASLPKATLTGY